MADLSVRYQGMERDHSLTTEQLQGIPTTARSLFNLLQHIAGGRPAEMEIVRADGAKSTMRVTIPVDG